MRYMHYRNLRNKLFLIIWKKNKLFYIRNIILPKVFESENNSEGLLSSTIVLTAFTVLFSTRSILCSSHCCNVVNKIYLLQFCNWNSRIPVLHLQVCNHEFSYTLAP